MTKIKMPTKKTLICIVCDSDYSVQQSAFMKKKHVYQTLYNDNKLNNIIM